MIQGPAMSHTQTSMQGRELRVQRTFQAPRELVFQAWTDPKHLPNWWGPNGFTITMQEFAMAEQQYGAVEGANQTLNRLESALSELNR